MYMLILLAALAVVIGVNMAVTRWQKRRFNPAEAGKDKMMVGMAPVPRSTLPHQATGYVPSVGGMSVAGSVENNDNKND